MSDRDELRNPLFRNWVRAAIGLKYLQQGLSCFVSNLSDQRHQSHLYSYRKVTGSLAHSCTECTTDNLIPEHPRKTCIQKYRSKCFCNNPAGRRPCPNNFCSRFYDLVVLDHDERNPVWTNTDPSRWHGDHWSFAQCFLATAGYHDKQSAAETDAAGLLSILLNNIEFRASLDNVSNFEMVRNTRNDVVHSPTFEIEEEELASIIGQFIGILQDKKSLINDADAQQAVSNLGKLKRDEVYISCQKAEELRREAMQAIAEKKEEALREIDQKTSESLQHIAEAKTQNTKILKATQTQTVEDPTTLSDKEKQELQSYLIDLYRKDYLKTDLSPLLPEVEIDVEKVYVPLKIERRIGNSVETTCILSLDDVFYCEGIQAETIYISGDAGIGKTTFCRKLISEWCHTHSTSSDISNSISSENTQQDRGTFVRMTSEKNISDHTESSSGCSNPVSIDEQYLAADVNVETSLEITADQTESSSNYDKSSITLRKRNNSTDENDCFPIDTDDENDCFLIETEDENDCFLIETDDESSGSIHSFGSSSPISTDENNLADVLEKDQIFTDKDKSTVMKQFDFLFFVSLRDTYKERSIEEMTLNQLLKTKKMREYFKFLVENETEKILYILDGLDEWTTPTPLPKHPNVTKGLPVNSCVGHFTTLFTSRPWKVETLRPKLRENDFDLSILGIEKTCSKRLIWLIFRKIISEKDEIDTNAVMFLQEVERIDMKCLCSVPLLLKLLICLWEKDQELADSQAEIYTSIINKLCSLAIERNSDNDKFQCLVSQLRGKYLNFPLSLKKESALLKFAALMYALGKFSFENISHKNQSGALVFKDKDLIDHGISEAECELSLKIGLLSKKKVIESSKMTPVRCISFMHKTFQEYFAALYISMAFGQNRIVEDKVREYFTSSETIMDLLKIITFVKEMCPALIDKVTEKVYIDEKDFIITIEESKLTLQTSMNNNTKLVAEFFMTYQIHKILVTSSNFGIHDLRLQMEMRNLEVLELHTVKMTSTAFKQILESLPETSSGVSVKLCHVVVRNPSSVDDNVHVSVTLNNLKSIEIDFMNMCGIEAQFSKHMKTIGRVKFHEVDMNEKELEQLLDSIPDTDQDIVLMFNDIHLKNVTNKDSNILSKTLNRTTNCQEFSFKSKHLKGVTFFWSGKRLSFKNMRLSEATKSVDELFMLIERVILDGDLATIVQIKTIFQEKRLQYGDLASAVIWLNIGMGIKRLQLTNIKLEDCKLYELLQNEKMVQLRSLQLYNITLTQTPGHTQQLTCEVLDSQDGNIFNNTKTNVQDALCSESVTKYQRDGAEIEKTLNETLMWIIMGSKIESFALDNIQWTKTCSSGKQIDLKEMSHFKFQGNLQSRQLLKKLYLKRISVPEKYFCSLVDNISSASVTPELTVVPVFAPPGFQIPGTMKEVRLEDLTLTTHAFRSLIESPNRDRNVYQLDNSLAVVLDNITLIDTFNSYTEVTCECPKSLTITRTNLLNLAIIFRSDTDDIDYSRKPYLLIPEILLENVTLTEKALYEMNESAWKVFHYKTVELDDDNTASCKTIKHMRLCGVKRPSFLGISYP